MLLAGSVSLMLSTTSFADINFFNWEHDHGHVVFNPVHEMGYRGACDKPHDGWHWTGIKCVKNSDKPAEAINSDKPAEAIPE